MDSRSLVALAAIAVSGCTSSPRAAAPRANKVAVVAPTDAGTDDERNMIDLGDGPMNVTWSKTKRMLSVETLPPIPLDDDDPLDCLRITGMAGVHVEKPPVLVVLSVQFGPHTCGTMSGKSVVYAFDGKSWTKVVRTMGSELHLRQDGPDIVEWKLVGAAEVYDLSSWSRTPRSRFPPSTPRATMERPYGFVAADLPDWARP